MEDIAHRLNLRPDFPSPSVDLAAIADDCHDFIVTKREQDAISVAQLIQLAEKNS